MADVRIIDLPSGAPTAAHKMPIDLSETQSATISDIGDAARPFASQAEAEAGTSNTKTMTPLTSAQQLAALGPTLFATASEGALAATALQPADVAALAFKDKAGIEDIDATGSPTSTTFLAGNGSWVFLPGGGNMLSSVYDPDSVGADAFDSANHSYVQDATGALSRPAIQKMRERWSSFDAMSSSLAAAIYNREVTTTDASEITAAVQNIVDDCVVKYRQIVFPGGIHYMNDAINTSQLISVRGEGEDQTVLRWTADAPDEGIHMVSGSDASSRRTAIISNLSMETMKAGLGNAAISIDMSAQKQGGNTVLPRAQTNGQIHRVKIRGYNLYTFSGWNKAIELTNCQGVHVSHSRLLGYVPTNGVRPTSARGIFFGGDGQPTQFSMDGTYITGFLEAVRVEESEGVYIQGGCEFVNVGSGVIVTAAGIQPAFDFIGNHVAAFDKCVSLTYQTECKIMGNILYAYQNSADPLIGIEVNEGCYYANIIGNSFNRSNTVTPYTCVLDNGDYTCIDLNQFSPGSTTDCLAIHLGPSSTNARIGHNAYRTATTRILNESSTPVRLPPTIVAESAVAASHTGDTTETTLATVTIPKGTIGKHGRVRVTALFSHTSSSNNKVLKVRANTITIASSTQTTTASTRLQIEISNRGDEASQIVNSASAGGWGGFSFNPTKITQNTATGALVITLTGQLVETTETVTLESYVVELFPSF